MLVLLSHGYFLHEDPKEQAIMKPYPPLGILYLSAWLDKHRVENAVFDTTFSTRETLQAYLLDQRPRIVALYVNLMTKQNVIALMGFIRSQEMLRNTLIVLGGPDVTHNAPDYLEVGADLIVVGEGEQTMLEIARTVDGGRETADGGQVDKFGSFYSIAGLVFKTAGGLIHRTAPREKLRDLDELPLPNRQKIDLQQYLDVWKKAHGHSAVSLSTQRGCPYTCRWCSTAVYGQSYRRRSPQAVADEIEWLQAQYTFDLIWFVDDVFTVSHKWLNEFHTELSRRKLQVQFECITRADRLNADVIQTLKAAGCFRVWIGAESGSQRIIDAMDRRVDVQQVRAMIQSARQAGIQAGTFIMLGYPGETEADIQATLEHLKLSNPDLFTITVAYPIKGTGLYEEVEPSAFSPLPWAGRSDRDIDFPRTYPRRYYDFAVRWTVNAVYWHKSKQARRAYTATGLLFWGKMWAARLGMWRFRFQHHFLQK